MLRQWRMLCCHCAKGQSTAHVCVSAFYLRMRYFGCRPLPSLLPPAPLIAAGPPAASQTLPNLSSLLSCPRDLPDPKSLALSALKMAQHSSLSSSAQSICSSLCTLPSRRLRELHICSL